MDRTMYKERIVIHYNWGHLKSLPLLDTTTILMAPQTPGEEITIPRGEMSYPFEFRLPSDLPPSTSDDLLWGGVFYFIEVKIIRDADNSPAWVQNHRKRKYIRDLTASIPFKVS